jgi:hypothetical protein
VRTTADAGSGVRATVGSGEEVSLDAPQADARIEMQQVRAASLPAITVIAAPL